MRIQHTDYGFIHESSVEAFTRREINRVGDTYGAMEEMKAAADNLTAAFGRLLDVLAQRGELTPEQVYEIVTGATARTVCFLPDEIGS